MRVEIHILQNFPPANLNRDDTGTPKDCEFGGERRARISSQCIKRSIRTHPVFAETLGEQIALRTKKSAGRVKELLVDQHQVDAEAARALAEAALDELISLGDENGAVRKTKVLYYAAPSELADLARCIAQAEADEETARVVEARRGVETLGEDATKKETKAVDEEFKNAHKALKKALSKPVKEFVNTNRDRARSVDIALFGRMLAEEPKLNLEAACQVAHAISTNRVSMEFDFYTAVDDLNPDEETGAGMIGTTGYNSSCFYRYMLIDVDHLATTLSPEDTPTDESYGRAVDGVKAFIRAAVAAIPTGKQTSFAAQARPSLVLSVVRPNNSMPMSLVNAFEKPAAPHRENGTTRSLVEDSIAKLGSHWGRMTAMYGDEGAQVFLAMSEDTALLDDEYAQEEEKAAIERLKEARVGGVPALTRGAVEALNGEVSA